MTSRSRGEIFFEAMAFVPWLALGLSIGLLKVIPLVMHPLNRAEHAHATEIAAFGGIALSGLGAVCSIVALCGVWRHRRVGLLVAAIAGLVVSAFLFAVSMPVFNA